MNEQALSEGTQTPSSDHTQLGNEQNGVLQRLVSEFDVWIVGDNYYEEATFENLGDLSCDVLGGTWYVEKFLRQCSTRDRANEFTIWTYPKPRVPKDSTFSGKHIFRNYRRQPDAVMPDTLRIETTRYTEPGEMDFDLEPISVKPRKMLVIEDMNMGYRVRGKNEWNPLLKLIREDERLVKSRKLAHACPYIVTLLGGTMPDFHSTDDKVIANCELWKTLVENHSHDTVVIVNADLLRFTGSKISRRVSWERTAQELVNELICNPRMQFLNEFAHLIIRFGVVAAIHCFKIGNDTHRILYYDTKAHDGLFRRIESEGGIIGNNSVFTSYIVSELLKKQPSDGAAESIGTAIKHAIPACQRLFRAGYPKVDHANKSSWLDNWPSKEVFSEGDVDEQQTVDLAKNRFAPTCVRYIRHAEVPLAVDGWSILKQSAAGGSMMDLAREIVFKGIKRSLNLPLSVSEHDDCRPHAPLARFNDITLLDREEIECSRGVYNIIQHYLSSTHDSRPLNIAIFGPPGSGKSVIVRELAAEIKPGWAIPIINMAQVTSMEDLSKRIQSHLEPPVADVKADDGTKSEEPVTKNETGGKPTASNDTLENVRILFFDEFDCNFEGKLGWLKYFLAIMEDGTIGVSDKKTVKLERCILFFAGGTKRTYQDFACENQSLSDEEQLQFEIAKGPDFISRLRGHINIKGVNRIDESDTVFLLRRAAIIRYCLSLANLIKHEDAMIDCGVLHAMLRIARYKHGARSIRALIAMCIPLNRRLEKASLPVDNLLDMHVSSVEFKTLIEDYRPHPDDPTPEPQTYIMS